MTAVHVIQRPLRGSRISTFYPIKSLPSLSSLDSAFQLQEYISLLIRLDVHDVDSIVSLPGTSKKDGEVKEPAEVSKEEDKDSEKKNDVQVDQACWIYEQLRRLAQDLSHPLITTLQQECSRATCPEMKAGEWLYLCVAHGNDGAMEQCCAIDYILHTVDSATALLNSPRTFPSRLQIPQTSHRHFASLARRLGRIFAHAYYSHREIFEQAEAESSLYARFLALTSKFELVPSEFLVIPSSQYAGEGERDARDGHDIHYRYPPHHHQQQHLEPPIPRVNVSPKIQQHQLGVGRPRSPLISPASDPSISVGGIGEHPTTGNGTRSRFGRNRTDTMVFADIELSGVADELAAKARAGEFDETEAPKSARLIIESVSNEPSREEGPEDRPEDRPGDMDLEPETQFEISLVEGNSSSGLMTLDILSAGVTTERNDSEDPVTPLPTPEEEEPGVLAAACIDSATMDEHIQATISEDVDEPDLTVAPDAETDSDLTHVNSEVKLVSDDEPETFTTDVSLGSNAPDLPHPDDIPTVENELVAEPIVVQSSADHPDQVGSEMEGDPSATTPETSDVQEAQATPS